jgi:hypothetical protein
MHSRKGNAANKQRGIGRYCVVSQIAASISEEHTVTIFRIETLALLLQDESNN